MSRMIFLRKFVSKRKNDHRSFIINKRGVSSLFLSIFLIMLTVMLISTVFVGLAFTRTENATSLLREKEISSEQISIQGPGGIKTMGPDVYSIRVYNTGSIFAKVRAIYVGQSLICDPSSYQDTSIAPTEDKWIDIVPNVPLAASLNQNWTVVTERGNRASELGMNLKYDPNNNDDSEGLIIGPLMIRFDEFYWKTGSLWNYGWTIPKGLSDPVTWGILVKNLDPSTIEIMPNSYIDLIPNDNIPNSNMIWYSSNPNIPIEYGEFAFLTFSGPKSINPSVSNRTHMCFLVLNGIYREEGVEPERSFGQTIPFEAVLTIQSPQLTVQASPTSINAGVSSQSLITATLTDNTGVPIPNALVGFTTDDANEHFKINFASTNLQGKATVTFLAGDSVGTVHITAATMGLTASTNVNITP